MDRKIRVAAVDYLNTKPLIYGFNDPAFAGRATLSLDFPANIAAKLQSGEADIALVPVAIIPSLKEAHLISDYCIGTEGSVASVCLFSDVPIEQIETVVLDYQSCTSVNLVKILFREYWKVDVHYQAALPGFEMEIGNNKAAVIIGDRALACRSKFRYVYDLAEAWKDLTGLPFVFAAWVANFLPAADFIQMFNEATGRGLNHLPEIVSQYPMEHYSLLHYFTENISYHLDEQKKLAMQLFLKKLSLQS